MTDQLELDHGYEAAERAAIYEFDGGMTREMAESKVIYQEELKKRKATCIDMKREVDWVG